MATTKKTTTKTKATVEEINEIIADTEVEQKAQEENVKLVASEPVKVKKTFTDSDYILCRSVTSGGLNVISPSGILYRFEDYDSEYEVNYRDLVNMIHRHYEDVFKPRFVILDEDFLEEFPTVKRVYGKMYTMNDLVEILSLPNTAMKREIEKLPKDTKDQMRNLIATRIANGKLDSISKVRILTEVFETDFNLLSDLFVK